MVDPAAAVPELAPVPGRDDGDDDDLARLSNMTAETVNHYVSMTPSGSVRRLHRLCECSLPALLAIQSKVGRHGDDRQNRYGNMAKPLSEMADDRGDLQGGASGKPIGCQSLKLLLGQSEQRVRRSWPSV